MPVDQTSRLISQRPVDVLGSYSAALMTGTIAAGAAANAPILSFRWTDAGSVALIHRVAVAVSSLGTGFTAGVGKVGVIQARAFSASDTGGTAIDLTTNTNSQKRRTTHRTSAVGDLRISNTAALSAGTRTLDPQEAAGVMFAVGTATNTVYLATTDMFRPDQSAGWPFLLEKNEGFMVRATVPATGTWQAQILVEWSEALAF